MTISNREHAVLGCLSAIPKKMLRSHGMNNISSLVLYDLCHENCFNVKKAAYFVDNPDFNICKGVAGYHRSESYYDISDAWSEPETFELIMNSCPFNAQVQTFEKNNLHVNGNGNADILDAISRHCLFENPHLVSWDMKHDNIGLLVYEQTDSESLSELEEHLYHGLHLFGFCPLF